ncbi:MAG: hypothetical protein A3H49_00145 [Nitrospirae bacterium RIFCSPLOWO2_02_FULL_62_14]|nr:MAG: hypothetical protein A3H49_00145 [Nitrospirae bacterium RIFCSPLOWO2_02_FULL_62_14]
MKVADLTVEELRALIKKAVQEELHELLDDPDAGLALRSEMEARIQASLVSTERISLAKVKERLALP